jgi:hypothetical protein
LNQENKNYPKYYVNREKYLIDSINLKLQFIQNDSKLNTKLVKLYQNLIKKTVKIMTDESSSLHLHLNKRGGYKCLHDILGGMPMYYICPKSIAVESGVVLD